MGTRIKSAIAGAGVALGLTLALPMGTAHATGETSCRAGVVKVTVATSPSAGYNRCFSGSGSLALNISDVVRLESGSRTVAFHYQAQSGGQTRVLKLAPGRYQNFAGIRLRQIVI